MKGILYLCATPIGNLEDISLRCLRILKEVDIIGAEDTRRTRKLLNYYGIKKHMISYHEHNKRSKGEDLIRFLEEGKNIAIVSDAGMPCISDPGEDIVKLCIQNGIEIIPIPGATASLAALSISGLSTEHFTFEGFLPVKGKDRRERLRRISEERNTIILYEAPHRILSTLKDLKEALGNRNISISRELTKKFEETIRTDIDTAVKEFSNRDIKGEFVLILEGKIGEIYKDCVWEDFTIEEHIRLNIEEGLTKKEAIAKVAKERNIPKKEVYKVSIEI